MRKLFIILLLVAGFVNAQNIIVSSKNSTTTALDSAATYTGTAELNTNYSYLTIVAKSNVSGASNGVIVKMGATASILYTNQFFTYTTNDSSTNRFTVHLTGKYFKVMYINGTTDQTTFDLRTYLHTEEVLPVDANGNIKVNVAVSALPSGAATADNQLTQISRAKADSLNFVAMKTQLDSITADLATVKKQAHPFTSSSGTTTTVSTEVDTTVFTSTVRQSFGAFAVNDTLQIALMGDFSDAKTVYPYTGYTFSNFSPATFTKGYIRRYGGAGTVSYIPTIVGY